MIPTDIDGSALLLPNWPVIRPDQTTAINMMLGRLLRGKPASGESIRGADGEHPECYYQAFYPRTVAMYRHLETITMLPDTCDVEGHALPDIPYFWEEVMRILDRWGTERLSSFDVLARLEVRLMDLREMTMIGVAHSVLSKGGYEPIRMADFA